MAFTNSPLVDYTLISPNKTVGRNHAIDMITIHCTGSGHTTVEKLGNGFHNPSRGASSNYGIGSDGRIGMYVEEKDRSWCTSSGDNDHRAITIEVSSEGTHPYKTKDICIEACIKLCADICKRNNIKALLWKGDASLLYNVAQQNVSVHRWLAAKACPGEYLYNKLTYICNEVNRRIGSSIVNPQVSLADNPNQKASKSSNKGFGGSFSSTNSQGSGGFAANFTSGVLSAALQASYSMSMGRKSSFTPYDDGTKMAKIKNARTNRAGAASQLYNKIKAVDTYIGQGHDTTSFITFSVNGFQLDTRAQNSFDHYAISLENAKTGVGQGNKFKLTIAYHKHFSNYSDINKLEQALGPLRQGSTMVNNFSTTRTNLTKNVCSLTYGYNASDNQLVSPTYIGLLLKYTVTADKQIVTYVLEGYTGEQVSVNTVNWYPNIVGMKQTTTGKLEQVALGTLDLKNSPSKPSDEQMRELIKELNIQYAGGITFQPYLALDCFLQDYNASVAQSGGTQYYLLDCTNQKRGRLSDENTLEPVHLSLCRGQTPIQYIEYCISLFKYKQTTNYAIQYLEQSGETSERFVYEFVRDPDTPQIMYICVDVIDSSDSDSKVAYTFTGYATDNNLLVDYNLNYDGTVALALSDSIDANNEDLNAIYIDSNGQLRAKQSITRDMFVFGEIEDVVVAKQNTWIDKVSVANQCTMTTFGLPFEISVGTVFKCGIYITDTLHHSSGNCFVTGMVDKIENNSFTTSFTMIRLPGRNSAIKD